VTVEFPDLGWVGISDDSVKRLRPGEDLDIEEGAIGRLPDEITLVLAGASYLRTSTSASHTLIVPAGAAVCFPKDKEVELCREMKLPPGSKVVWPHDSEHSVPELMQIRTLAKEEGLSLWIREGTGLTLPKSGFPLSQ
jgi:hypothetical protein